MEQLKEILLNKVNQSELEVQVFFIEDIEDDQISSKSFESIAKYEPISNTLSVSLKKTKQRMLNIPAQEKNAFIDSLISHKLGHVADRRTENNWDTLKKLRARWKELLFNLYEDTDRVVRELSGIYKKMRIINLELESNAWELGKYFCNYPTVYEKYNVENFLSHMKMYKIYEDMLARLVNKKERETI